PAVADPFDVVDDRPGRVAGADEVGVQRVDVLAGRHGAPGGDEGLGGDLPAEDALDPLLRAAAAEHVLLDLLQVEQVEHFLQGLVHPVPLHVGARAAPGPTLVWWHCAVSRRLSPEQITRKRAPFSDRSPGTDPAPLPRTGRP